MLDNRGDVIREIRHNLQGRCMPKMAGLVLCALLSLGVTSCAMRNTTGSKPQTVEIRDPIEPVNRAVFAFNDFLDLMLIEPAAKVYNALLPGFLRDGLRNVIRNLKTPLIVGNDLLQGNPRAAGKAAARFLLNSTAGIAGLIDVAEAQGLPYDSTTFGETLGVWGFGEGFYVVLPVMGPSNLRDVAGRAVDGYADPVRLWAFNTDHRWSYYTRNAVEGIDNRARLIKAVRDLRRNSLDYYAAVRSAYTQKHASSAQDFPDYDEAEDGKSAGNGKK